MPNARTNWIGTITRIRRNVKRSASSNAASWTIVSIAENVQLPFSSRNASPNPWIIGQTKNRPR